MLCGIGYLHEIGVAHRDLKVIYHHLYLFSKDCCYPNRKLVDRSNIVNHQLIDSLPPPPLVSFSLRTCFAPLKMIV